MKCIMVLLFWVKLHNRSHAVRLDTSTEKSKRSLNNAHMSKGRGQVSTRCHHTISPHQNSRQILGMENSGSFRAAAQRSLTPLSNPPTPHHNKIQRTWQFGWSNCNSIHTRARAAARVARLAWRWHHTMTHTNSFGSGINVLYCACCSMCDSVLQSKEILVRGWS